MRKTGVAVASAVLLLGCWHPAPAWSALTVELVNGYNLVVDSNVTAPSTYGPQSAYVGAKVCNTDPAAALTNVFAHLGDSAGGGPGVFPVVTFGDDALRPHLTGTGSYSLTLEAGATGAADGTRYVGTLNPGECRMQYWLISYPQCVNVGGEPQSPPCDASITGTVKPDDDLSLGYDVWATADGGASAAASGGFTMRNEISAAANKIWPNTTAKVPDDYLAAIQTIIGWGTIGPDGQPLTAASAVYPGQRLITTQGIWYDLGNVGAGFDNDGDLVPDHNAWLQPVGDPAFFDADCFRLVNLYGIVIVKLTTGEDLLIPFQNQLYFENLPDNTGVVGLVYYQFIATGEGCSATMTPYQEAASGFDNEKFSADFGLGLELISGSYGAGLAFSKTDSAASTGAGSVQTYVVSAANTTGVNLGAPDLGAPLVFRERIPAWGTYVAGSADDQLTEPADPPGAAFFDQGYTDTAGNPVTCRINYTITSSGYSILYSGDGGATWGTAEPASVTDIQWLLLTTIALDGSFNGTACEAPDGAFDDGTLPTSLPAGASAGVSLGIRLAANPGPVVCNTASLGFGSSTAGPQARDCTLVTGNNRLSGRVFRDDGTGGGIYGNSTRDGGEAGIGAASAPSVIVDLYYDADRDGRLSLEDLFYATASTAADGTYSFANLPDGPFLAAARKYDGPASDGVANAVNDYVPGWGNTTRDPNLPLTADQGVVRMSEDATQLVLAVNIDLDGSNGANQPADNVDFGFAPPLRLAKGVAGNADANADGKADAPVDEGDLVTYAITLENRLPNAGVQGPAGCEYTVWATTGANGTPASKEFTSAANAWDATSPNRTVASALVTGGGLRFIEGSGFPQAQRPGAILRVESLMYGYFGTALTDDFLNMRIAYGGSEVSGTVSTAMIESYVGEPAKLDANSAMVWDVTNRKPGGGPWTWTDFAGVSLRVNPTKTAAADAKWFYLDAIGLRVTTDASCTASDSTTLSPVPLQDDYDAARFTYVSADPAPASVDTATGLIAWDDVGPILPGTSAAVRVTLRAIDVDGTVSGTCAGPTACNSATTDFGAKDVLYADGRRANDASDEIAVDIVGKAELHGRVWSDLDNTGWPAGGAEAGLPGVTVTLYACVQSDGVTLETGTPNKTCLNATGGNFWAPLATAVTGASGDYGFIGLDTGYYLVEVGDTDGQPASGAGGNLAPYGKTQTAEPADSQAVTGGNANAPTQGSFNNTWGDPGLNLSALNLLSRTTEETVNGVNFGYYSAAAVVYGAIWQDADGDAARDPGDEGAAGFTVRLYSDPNADGDPSDGALQLTTSSDANGAYAFSGLAAGSYVIVTTPSTLPSNAWAETVESTGGTGSLNNQIPVTLSAGQLSGSHDFGYTLTVTSRIGDSVYFDFDADGVQDPAETGIPGVTVRIYGDADRDGRIDPGTDALLAADVTDADGGYLFEGLPRGSYVVVVDTADPDFPADVTATGDPDLPSGSIGDRVWLDADNGLDQDAGEDGIPEVTVLLYADDGDTPGTFDGNDTPIAATTTNLNGAYLFTGLAAGTYFVDVDETTLPAAALARTTAAPTGAPITLATSSGSHLAADVGYSPAANYALGNRVWSDADGDGLQDAGEAGIGGVDVAVTQAGNAAQPCFTTSPCRATTDPDGFWIVTGLLTGSTYAVAVDTADLVVNSASTTGGNTLSRTIAGADLMNADFGYRYNTDGNLATRDDGDPTGTVSGRAFLDADGDAAYDAGEGLGGVTINLYNGDGELAATSASAADGSYGFTGLAIGTYSVQALDGRGTRYSTVFLNASENFSNLNVAYDAASESGADSMSSVSVDGVHDDLNQDFGYQRFQGSVGDTVYQDVNENATQDAGEPGIGGVTVGLHLWSDALADGGDGDGVVDAPELSLQRTAVTTADDPLTPADEGGKYLFSNLETPPAGRFFLVRLDTATLPGTASLIADPDTDGEPCPLVAPLNPVCDSQQVVGGFSGRTNYLGADFGYRLGGAGHATVGDHLWIDGDGDGVLDAGEPGVPFVRVWFDTDDDEVVDWLDANANGAWDAGEGERWVESDSDGYFVFTGLADTGGGSDYRNLSVDTGDPDWPAGLGTTPTHEGGGDPSPENDIDVVIAGGAVTSLDGGGCTGCNLDADFGFRFNHPGSLSGTICTESGTDGFCGDDAADHSGVGAGETAVAGFLVSLYRWDDADGDNRAWDDATGALDPGDGFTLLGSTSTDANGDYSFADVPAGAVVAFGVAAAAKLDLTTAYATSGVDGAVNRQLYEGTATHEGDLVTVTGRQALAITGAAADVDFVFDARLATTAYDFGDLPAAYDATLLASGGARHRVTSASIRLGAAVTAESDGQEADFANADGNDDGVFLMSERLVTGPDNGGVTVTASAPGWLAGWVDFNRDGDFADAGELIISQSVAAGENDIYFDIPATLTTDVYFSRFRIYPSQPQLVASAGLAFDAFLRLATGEVEDYQWNLSVTRVLLSSFTARRDEGEVAVEWVTSSEVNTVGFHLLRRDAGSGGFSRVNASLLPSLVQTPRGGTYRYRDRTAPAGAAPEYLLVEVEASGAQSTHGPIRVETGAPPRAGRAAAAGAGAADFEARPRAAAGRAPDRALGSRVHRVEPRYPAPQPGNRAKISVRESGLHFVGIEELAANLGVSVAAAKAGFKRGAFGLQSLGRPVAWLPAAGYRGIYFYGRRLESPYTLENVYWAARGGKSVRMKTRPRRAAAPAAGTETFVRTVREERDVIAAMGLFTDAASDWWLWDYFSAGEEPKSFAVRSDGLAGGPGAASLTVRLKGGSDTGADPDHHAVIRVNGAQVGDLRWDGLGEIEQTFSFPAGLLVDGENAVQILALGDTGAEYSFFFLDSLALSYPSAYRAREDRLECSSEGHRAILLSGFTSPGIRVLDVTDPGNPVFVRARALRLEDGTYGVALSPRRPGTLYHAVTQDRVRPAARIASRPPPSLRGTRNRGGYLIVTTAELAGAAQRLAGLRAGLEPRVVDIQDVYDEFAHGIPSPLALKAFLAHARRTWELPPRMVVLAGDGTYDYRDLEGAGGNLVPPLMVGTPHGIYPSDNRFADTEGDDGVPEISIGRLPVADEAALHRVIDKIVARELAGPGGWKDQALLLADDADDAGDFPADSDRIAELATPLQGVRRIHLSNLAVEKARELLFAGLGDGAGIVNYVGHGGYDMLADEGLLGSADVGTLANAESPTILTALTCIVGNFAQPGFPALSQELVRRAGGGAAAVWAPSGMSQGRLATRLAEDFYGTYFQDPQVKTLGEAVLRALRAYGRNAKNSYMLDIYVLLGDPALALR